MSDFNNSEFIASINNLEKIHAKNGSVFVVNELFRKYVSG
jgi:hypothetical protein